MADKMRYTAKLNAKGLDNHITEEQAGQMARHQGSHYLLIIEAHAGPKTVDEDGSEHVSLIADLVELVPEEHADTVRTFQRSLYLARPDQHGQAAFETAQPGEVPVDVAAAGLAAATPDDDGTWSGDPDEPITRPGLAAVPDPFDPAAGHREECPHPDCDRPEDHEGPHMLLSDDPVTAPADDEDESVES